MQALHMLFAPCLGSPAACISFSTDRGPRSISIQAEVVDVCVLKCQANSFMQLATLPGPRLAFKLDVSDLLRTNL